jgi:hypothetical protein
MHCCIGLLESKFSSNLICFGANGTILKGQNKGDNVIEEEAHSFMLGFHGMEALSKLFFIYKFEASFKYFSTYYLQNTTCATLRDANRYVELFLEYKVQFFLKIKTQWISILSSNK